MRTCRIISACLFLFSALWSTEPQAIRIESQEDYAILDQFFKTMLTFEEYGYVLEGSKPISIKNFGSLDQLTVTRDFEAAATEFSNALLVRKTLEIWNRLCSHQKKFVLKAVVLKNPESIAPALEVQFINTSKLREVIDKSIDLFRYILGPTLTTEQIVDKIAFSDELFMESLQHNLTLVGIVLGFGSHNSVVGGRIETISALTISRDVAPFTPQSFMMHSKKEHSLDFLTGSYGCHYLEFAGGGDDTYFRHELPLLRPSPGFANLEEEVIAIDALHEPIPLSLWERPRFVFGPFVGGPPNLPFIEELQQTQQRIRELLEKPNFLEQILEKIGGVKPIISDQDTFEEPIWSLLNAKEWSQILWSAASHFESKKEQSAFIEAFQNPTRCAQNVPIMLGASKDMLKGLKIAFSNLQKSEAQFKTLSKKASEDKSLEVIVPEKLYFKTTLSGSGKPLNQHDHVRVGYVIEDMKKKVLFANCDTWLRLSQTIPGFSHGMQGMRIGEKRTIFVHPVFGYGATTTLPPCIGLTIKVHLLDVEEGAPKALPALIPLSLNWIQDPDFHRKIEESICKRPYFVGSFYRSLLDKMQEAEKIAVLTELDKRPGFKNTR